MPNKFPATDLMKQALAQSNEAMIGGKQSFSHYCLMQSNAMYKAYAAGVAAAQHGSTGGYHALIMKWANKTPFEDHDSP